MRLRIFSVVTAGIVALLAVSLTVASDMRAGNDHASAPYVDEWLSSYRTVEEAQLEVPFDIRVPSVPEDYRFSYVQVDRVPIADQTEKLILIESIFITDSGGHLMLSQGNRPGTPPEGAHVSQATINDVSVQIKPRMSPHGTETATLYWESEGFTYYLIASELPIEHLLQMAESIVQG